MIIGCGPSTEGKGRWHSFSYAHGWAYAQSPETQLVAAASRTKRNVDDFAAEFRGINGYQNYRRMLEKEKPDMVSVCAFPRDREEMVLASLEAGAKGVWAEKPFALSLKSARRMMEVAEKGARLFVNHQRRYGRPFQWMREAIKEKKIGELIGIDIVQSGTNLLDSGPHLIDAALYFLGQRQAEEVLAAVDISEISEYQGVPVEKHSFATVHLSDGVRLTIEAGAGTRLRLPIIRAQGSDGFAELHAEVPPGSKSIFRALFRGEAEIFNPPTNEHFHHSEDSNLYVTRALADIVQGLKTGRPTRIDAEGAVRGLEIILAIYESARLGKTVRLPLQQEEFPLDLWLRERRKLPPFHLPHAETHPPP